MHRIDGDAAVNAMFSEGPPGTEVTADFMNDVQENLCTLLEAMGVVLAKGNHTQLRDACVSAATALKIVRRDAAGRAKVADPSAVDDIDTKGARDAAISAFAAASMKPAAMGQTYYVNGSQLWTKKIAGATTPSGARIAQGMYDVNHFTGIANYVVVIEPDTNTPGTRFAVYNKTADGFRVLFHDAAGNPVDRSFHWAVLG
jgi:hypothetical protein